MRKFSGILLSPLSKVGKGSSRMVAELPASRDRSTLLECELAQARASKHVADGLNISCLCLCLSQLNRPIFIEARF